MGWKPVPFTPLTVHPPPAGITGMLAIACSTLGGLTPHAQQSTAARNTAKVAAGLYTIPLLTAGSRQRLCDSRGRRAGLCLVTGVATCVPPDLPQASSQQRLGASDE